MIILVFYGYLSGYENLRLIENLLPGIKKNRIDEVIEMVDLKGREKDKVKTYSLGMKQRHGIAQALLGSPDLLVIDEPTNGLDPRAMKEISEMIRNLAVSRNISFVISTHLLHEVEQLCNRAGILKKGKLLKEDKIENFLRGSYEVIEVHTNDKGLAAEALKESTLIKSVKPFEEGLIVNIDKGMSSKLNQFLISRNVDVKYLIPKSNFLENFFLELTEEADSKVVNA